MKIKKHCCVLISILISVLCVVFSAGCNFSEHFAPDSTEEPANESHDHDYEYSYDYDFGFEHYPSSKDEDGYNQNEKPVVSIPAQEISESDNEILKLYAKIYFILKLF